MMMLSAHDDINGATKTTSSSPLRALGFCGVDDSVHPNLLALISQAYPLVEFGVLFRPDKEGQPRYATRLWVEQLVHLAHRCRNSMKLAAHLCGSRVNDVLSGQIDFVQQLQDWGFRRVQINATAVNGVDTSRLASSVPVLLKICAKFPRLEFVLQQNDETSKLWQGVLHHGRPDNVTMLLDESKGRGVVSKSWPTAPDDYDSIGYAGGLGPENLTRLLPFIVVAANDKPFWIDMESSLRSRKDGKDAFDIQKCYEVIVAVCEHGLMPHPALFLQETDEEPNGNRRWSG